jgi:hypothetical protein
LEDRLCVTLNMYELNCVGVQNEANEEAEADNDNIQMRIRSGSMKDAGG